MKPIRSSLALSAKPTLAPANRPLTGRRRRAPEAAFTMVEIALALAIVGFAMVAIIGVLPTGLSVQRDNSQDTMINQDAGVLMEAIRSGAEGMDDLTNYVDFITISNTQSTLTFTNAQARVQNRLTSGREIIGLLSYPRYLANTRSRGSWITNTVTAQIRAMSGPAATQSPQNASLAFTYQVTSEAVPLSLAPFDVASSSQGNGALDTNQWYAAQNAATNFYQLRLIFQWPVYRKGNGYGVGSGRKVYSTIVAGRLVQEPIPGVPAGVATYFFEPSRFTALHIPPSAASLSNPPFLNF